MRGAAPCFASLLAPAAAHYGMVYPPSWHDHGGYVQQTPGKMCFQTGCFNKTAPGEPKEDKGEAGCSCYWHTNWTHIPDDVEATIPGDETGAPCTKNCNLRTFFNKCCASLNGKKCLDPQPGASMGHAFVCDSRNPWRAPGTAPVNSPCGVDGGNPHGCPPGNPNPDGCTTGGYAYGPDAITYPFPDVLTTTWKAGSTVTAAWSLAANHGGGYAYRLAKLPSGGKKDLTEEMFQAATPLTYADDIHTVLYANGSRATFPAARTNDPKIVHPAGTTWTRIPIPACGGLFGGASPLAAVAPCRGGYQFPAPLPGLSGYYGGIFTNKGEGGKIQSNGDKLGGYSFEDHLVVPKDLTPGKYVLSWRIDAEQTPQVWLTCADIEIIA